MSNDQADGQSYFALVNYTPKPLANWLLRLRRTLGVAPTSPPHITILPPRPLTLSVPEAKQKLTSMLAFWGGIQIELTDVRVFPGSNVLYLEVNDGSSMLRRLHSELNTGDFAHQENFEFHPHVTIGGPVASENLDAIAAKATAAWQKSRCPRHFRIDEVAFVSISAQGEQGDWQRLWSYNLAGTTSFPFAAQAAVS